MSFDALQQIGPTHPQLADYVAYRDNLHGNPERWVPLEGVWGHQVAFKLGLEIRAGFICPELLRAPEYVRAAEELAKRARAVYRVSEKVFDKISDRDGPSGIASLVKATTWHDDLANIAGRRYIVAMDAVEIPGNIGTILRTLDGLGEGALVLTNRRVRLTHPKVVKGSLGAIFTVPVVDSSIEKLGEFVRVHNLPMIVADSNGGVDFGSFKAPERFCLFLGSEKYGVPKEVAPFASQKVLLKMAGVCDSLNVSIAGSILLYGLTQRKEA
jgi:tRNA G18 (ribose-2'-O)-methylase SpoU